LDSALASETGVDGINEQTLDKENQEPGPDPDEYDGNYLLLTTIKIAILGFHL